ncbi:MULTISPECIES: amidohydrolase family protein [Rhodococcus]|uniref:amidohydrolase family protein n=1 Tax=Rhodococcus sp. PAE-6 TaxID=2972477 RepID=UPI0028C48C49|nr:amidohydrolase family protein [Rhodococcus sp. PAE-6]
MFVGADGAFTAEPGRDGEVLCADGWILPGLVDAHCHVGLRFGGGAEDEEGLLAQAVTERDAGVLLLRDAGSPVDTRALDQRADLSRIIRAGRHIALPKRYIRGLPVDLEDESQLPDEVARQAQAGEGWVKLIGDWIDREAGDLAPLWSDEILVEAIAAAHREGARVTAHVLGEDALSGLLAAGIDCIEHGTGLTDETIGAAHEAGIPIYAGTDAGGQVQHGRIADEIASLVRVGLDPTEAYAVRPGGLGAPRAAVERVRGVTGCRFRPGSRVWQNGSLSSHPVTYRAAVTG